MTSSFAWRIVKREYFEGDSNCFNWLPNSYLEAGEYVPLYIYILGNAYKTNIKMVFNIYYDIWHPTLIPCIMCHPLKYCLQHHVSFIIPFLFHHTRSIWNITTTSWHIYTHRWNFKRYLWCRKKPRIFTIQNLSCVKTWQL